MQTNIQENPAPFQAGQIADMGFTRDIVTRLLATGGAIGGRGAIHDSGVDDMDQIRQIIVAATPVFVGVVLTDTSREASDPLYQVTDAVPVMKKGRVAVEVEEAIADGDGVFVRVAVGTAATLGAFRNDADTATAVEVEGAKWVSESITVDGVLVAVLEINLP